MSVAADCRKPGKSNSNGKCKKDDHGFHCFPLL
jgi:hypothetical protein